jgi:hypothetical protein
MQTWLSEVNSGCFLEPLSAASTAASPTRDCAAAADPAPAPSAPTGAPLPLPPLSAALGEAPPLAAPAPAPFHVDVAVAVAVCKGSKATLNDAYTGRWSLVRMLSSELYATHSTMPFLGTKRILSVQDGMRPLLLVSYTSVPTSYLYVGRKFSGPSVI